MNRSLTNYFTETENKTEPKDFRNKALSGLKWANLNPFKSPRNPKAPDIPKPKVTFKSFNK